MEKSNTPKKVFGIIKTVLTWIVIAMAVFMMIFTLISVNVFDKNERSLFGYKFFVVTSNSMAATDFDAGDVVISKEIDARKLKEGDIITFISQSSENYGEVVTHKIREKTTDEDGSIAFVTYGTTTNNNDEALATIILGKYQGHIPNLGRFFLFLKTTPGYIVCILVPFLLLILSQGINVIRLFRRYRQEQMAEMKAERDKLEEERAESQRMMAELLQLKAQLEKKESEAVKSEEVEVNEPQDEEPAVEEPKAENVEEGATEEAPANQD